VDFLYPLAWVTLPFEDSLVELSQLVEGLGSPEWVCLLPGTNIPQNHWQ